MNKKIYSIAEFRKCTREVFNLVDSQEDVYIERFGKKYIILPESYYLELLKPETQSKPIEIKLPQPSIQRLQQGVCKIHSTPLDSRGKCLQKGCKYA